MNTEIMAYPYAPIPSKPHLARLPKCEISIAQTGDGRYLWGFSYASGCLGFSSAPLEKWGRFTYTSQASVVAAADHIRQRCKTIDMGVAAWLDGLCSNTQLELFQ